MLETLKNFHRAAEVAKAKAAEIAAQVEDAERHIAALADALHEDEQAIYGKWLAERQAAAAKAKA